MKNLTNSLTNLLVNKLTGFSKFKKYIINSLHTLLNGNYVKYDIYNTKCDEKEISDETFQKTLYSINEKSSIRKEKGVYYTPSDVTKYIISNSFINYLFNNNNTMHNYLDCIDIISSCSKRIVNNVLYKTSVFDPTCGSGEYLVNTFNFKFDILNKIDEVNDNNILKICSTIFGNDVDDNSNDISKIRLYFRIAGLLTKKESFEKLSNILKNNFYNYDFIFGYKKINKAFSIIVGNPPYVEYGRYPQKSKLTNNYGNIYADIIRNSIELLEEKGTLGFIIPLSYCATSRMSKIREFVNSKSNKQFILSFADRPDCLFDGVHQKLNIIIVCKGNGKNKIYTSNYKHWYNSERKDLLNGRETIQAKYIFDEYIPKIGNQIEGKIFSKIISNNKKNILNSVSKKDNKSIYLNMRACFWIKAFTFNPGSNEYKEFKYDKNEYYFMYCLLNSSLFWIFWTMISDCWHITTKELVHFGIPNDKTIDYSIFEKLAKSLEEKLEKTKKYVGTKQTEYEYKHKMCKDIIDKIDNELSKVYNLSDEELLYVKNFALNYRLGGDVGNESN